MTFLAAAVVFVLDRLTKFIIINNVSSGQSIGVIPNIFHLTLVLNNGTAFGLAKNRNTFFILLSLLIIFLLVMYILRRKPTGAMLSLSLGLILGGAVGNLIDRIRFGCVIDFLDFRIWPVFNVADSCITIGAIILAWRALLNPKIKYQNPK